MGTRAIVNVYDVVDNFNEGKIVSIYSQWDGYPSGIGRELSVFLNNIHLVNGFTRQETRRIANGMGCLAAQIVSHFKKEVGSFYLVSCNENEHGQDYTYDVYQDKVRVTNYSGEVIFLGSWEDFSDFCIDDDS